MDLSGCFSLPFVFGCYLGFGRRSSLCVLPFRFLALSQLWMLLVLSLCSSLLLLGIVSAMDVGSLFVFLAFVSRRCLGFWMMVLSLCSLFLFLGIVSALDVGPLFVFHPFVFGCCHDFGCCSSLCVPPLLFLGVVSTLDVGPFFVFFGCWSSLCVPCFCL